MTCPGEAYDGVPGPLRSRAGRTKTSVLDRRGKSRHAWLRHGVGPTGPRNTRSLARARHLVMELIWYMSKVGWYRCEVIQRIPNSMIPGSTEWIVLRSASPTCLTSAKGWPYDERDIMVKYASHPFSLDDIPPLDTPLPRVAGTSVARIRKPKKVRRKPIGIPAFTTLIFDETANGPLMGVGGGCSPDPEKAIMRALTEALGVYHWLRIPNNDDGFELPQNYEPFSLSIGQRKRLILWGKPSMKDKLDFFLCGPTKSLKESVIDDKLNEEEDLARLIENFRQKGDEYEVFIYEAKHPVLQAVGYYSVRVVVPALVPLYLNEIYAPLGAKRIKEVPQLLGYAATSEINPWPHPFP